MSNNLQILRHSVQKNKSVPLFYEALTKVLFTIEICTVKVFTENYT